MCMPTFERARNGQVNTHVRKVNVVVMKQMNIPYDPKTCKAKDGKLLAKSLQKLAELGGAGDIISEQLAPDWNGSRLSEADVLSVKAGGEFRSDAERGTSPSSSCEVSILRPQDRAPSSPNITSLAQPGARVFTRSQAVSRLHALFRLPRTHTRRNHAPQPGPCFARRRRFILESEAAP